MSNIKSFLSFILSISSCHPFHLIWKPDVVCACFWNFLSRTAWAIQANKTNQAGTEWLRVLFTMRSRRWATTHLQIQWLYVRTHSNGIEKEKKKRTVGFVFSCDEKDQIEKRQKKTWKVKSMGYKDVKVWKSDKLQQEKTKKSTFIRDLEFNASGYLVIKPYFTKYKLAINFHKTQ